MTRMVRVGTICICALVVIGGVASTTAGAAEIGCDASLGVGDVAADGSRIIYFAIPGAPGIGGGVFQTFRAAFPIGGLGAIEFAPGLSVTSYSRDATGGARQTSTTRQLSLGVSYLRGRTTTAGAAPYARAGVQARFLDYSDESGVYQAGAVVGGGLRWRLGGVIGLRSEVSVAKWFKGDYHGQWDGQVRFGISAFTK